MQHFDHNPRIALVYSMNSCTHKIKLMGLYRDVSLRTKGTSK